MKYALLIVLLHAGCAGLSRGALTYAISTERYELNGTFAEVTAGADMVFEPMGAKRRSESPDRLRFFIGSRSSLSLRQVGGILEVRSFAISNLGSDDERRMRFLRARVSGLPGVGARIVGARAAVEVVPDRDEAPNIPKPNSSPSSRRKQ